MEKLYIIENRKERERLIQLANSLTNEDLILVIYQEGWTIAVVLAHLAFWDNYALALLKRWQKDGVSPSHHEWDNINDALLPVVLAISPRTAANMAILTADKVDHEIEKVSAEFVKKVEGLKEPYRLNRSIHRKAHLDEIEAFLKSKRAGN
jgi:hypothetical protein